MRLILAVAAAILLASAGARSQTAAVPDFRPAEVLSSVDADYPIQSIAAGTVVLEVRVLKTGKIDTVKVVRDIPSLTESAKAAVVQWKFKPATLNGKPMDSFVAVAVTFVRQDLFPRFGK